MTLRYSAEIAANLKRASFSIKAAEDLFTGGFFDFVASRAYYAAFYAATALLLSDDMEFTKHSGLIAAIHQQYVKKGKLETEHGKNLNWLFELRGVGDYGETVHVSKEDARKAIEAAQEFVNVVKFLIERKEHSR
jgi:uncharacterized protein (UPF0332 family)